MEDRVRFPAGVYQLRKVMIKMNTIMIVPDKNIVAWLEKNDLRSPMTPKLRHAVVKAARAIKKLEKKLPAGWRIMFSDIEKYGRS